MPPFGHFFLPGPTEVHPEVLAAMARPVLGHRGAELAALIESVQPTLRRLFRTERPVYLSTSSATGLMEAGVRNGVLRRALCLVGGAFAERFRDLVRDCGREEETYAVEWGEAHDAEVVERRLRAGGFDAVTVVHSETSTGVLNPLAEIADAVRRAEAATGEEILLLVDGVTSVGGVAVEMDRWGLDWLLTGSHKAIALPPGLAFGAASERMLARAATLPGRGQYFDLLELDAHARRHQTATTPAVSLLFALAAQARRIDAEGIAPRAERHLAMARLCWEWTERNAGRSGISLLAPTGRRSPTVTAIRLPPGRSGPEVAGAMERRGWTIGAGYGKLKESTIRIGHMGDHTVDELGALLGELEEVLEG